jgi:hypothetical protein
MPWKLDLLLPHNTEKIRILGNTWMCNEFQWTLSNCRTPAVGLSLYSDSTTVWILSPSQNYQRLQKPSRVPPRGHLLGLPDQFNWVATSGIGDCLEGSCAIEISSIVCFTTQTEGTLHLIFFSCSEVNSRSCE